MFTISGAVLRLWGLRGPQDLLYHWHLSLILSCLVVGTWCHITTVTSALSVLDLWEFHGLLRF